MRRTPARVYRQVAPCLACRPRAIWTLNSNPVTSGAIASAHLSRRTVRQGIVGPCGRRLCAGDRWHGSEIGRQLPEAAQHHRERVHPGEVGESGQRGERAHGANCQRDVAHRHQIRKRVATNRETVENDTAGDIAYVHTRAMDSRRWRISATSSRTRREPSLTSGTTAVATSIRKASTFSNGSTSSGPAHRRTHVGTAPASGHRRTESHDGERALRIGQ